MGRGSEAGRGKQQKGSEGKEDPGHSRQGEHRAQPERGVKASGTLWNPWEWEDLCEYMVCWSLTAYHTETGRAHRKETVVWPMYQ